MRLEITAVAATSTIPFPPTELSIALPDSLAGPDEAAEESPAAAGRSSEASGAESSGMTVARVVAEKWPGCSFTVAGFPLEGLHVGREPLTDGAVVLVHSGAATATNPLRSVPPDSSAAPERRHEPSAPALLAVRSGPGAGAMYPLHRGTYRLGRGRCEITIADPTLSRHHGTLTVGESAMTLSAEKGSAGFDVLRQWLQTPAASTTPLKGVMAIEAGDVIRCGMSSFAILLSTPANDGGLGVGMPPGLLDAAVLEPLPLSVSSGPQRGRRAMLAAGLLPLVVGVLFAWLTGSWMFLAFAAMGAVTVLVPL
ncbi:MAG: FHA domain-containing protein, partial [Specibacter sp.]